MQQTGCVVEKRGEEALVRFAVAGACTGACRTCGGSEHSVQRSYWARNEAGAEPGQRVLVDFNATQAIKSASVLFITPIVAVVLGALAGSRWLNLPGEKGAVVGAAILLGIAIGGIMLYDRRLRKQGSYRPAIVRIVENEGKNLDCRPSADL